MDENLNLDREYKKKIDKETYYCAHDENQDTSQKHFNDLGSGFFNMGGKLQNANPELRRDRDFLKGYQRAERLNKIKNGGSR